MKPVPHNCCICCMVMLLTVVGQLMLRTQQKGSTPTFVDTSAGEVKVVDN